MIGYSGNDHKKTFILPEVVPFFTVVPKPLLEVYLFLAVQDSSIGDLVTDSLTE